MIASAPGKVLLAGEYAVLDGAPAVVVAVDRRAVATLGAAPVLSPFLEAARAELSARFGGESPAARAAAHVIVDSAALADGDRKLGLGSSAAATVAAIACALGGPVDARLIHELAHAAHARAQEPRGSRGSGADVAASVWGGALRVQRGDDPARPLAVRPLPFPVELVLIWTGRPADTPTLVAAVRQLRTREPASHESSMRTLGDAAAHLAAAFEAHDAAAAVRAIAEGAEAVATLGARAGVPLVPAETEAVDRLARRHRGAAKPTGAGGGDLVAALFPDAPTAAAFTADARAGGLTVVTARPTRLGATVAIPSESE